MTCPGFSAEAPLRLGVTGFRSSLAAAPDADRIEPAARPVFYRSMKGFCIDLRDHGGSKICCNGDECGPNVFI